LTIQADRVVGIAEASDCDEAAVGRLPDLVDGALSVARGRLDDARPHEAAGRVELLDEAALRGADRLQAAAERPAADDAAAVGRLLERDTEGVVAGWKAEAADELLPLRGCRQRRA
jgi:hypothetical protein